MVGFLDKGEGIINFEGNGGSVRLVCYNDMVCLNFENSLGLGKLFVWMDEWMECV